MTSIGVYNFKGKVSGRLQLPKEIFSAKISRPLMLQAIRAYSNNQRRALAKVKNRGEVAGSGVKIYRQKGTGRARHGDRYAPIFVGGGIAHGPRGIPKKKLKVSKRMRRLALFSALSYKLKEKKIVFIDGLEKIKPKTKEISQLIKNCQLKGKILLLLSGKSENLIRAAKNIKEFKLIPIKQISTYEILNGGTLIFSKDGLKILKEAFLS